MMRGQDETVKYKISHSVLTVLIYNRLSDNFKSNIVYNTVVSSVISVTWVVPLSPLVLFIVV